MILDFVVRNIRQPASYSHSDDSRSCLNEPAEDAVDHRCVVLLVDHLHLLRVGEVGDGREVEAELLPIQRRRQGSLGLGGERAAGLTPFSAGHHSGNQLAELGDDACGERHVLVVDKLAC